MELNGQYEIAHADGSSIHKSTHARGFFQQNEESIPKDLRQQVTSKTCHMSCKRKYAHRQQITSDPEKIKTHGCKHGAHLFLRKIGM